MKQRNARGNDLRQRSLLSPRTILLWRPFWLLVFVILIVGALFGLGLYLFSPEWTHTHQDLAVDLRSSLRADYSADPLHLLRVPLQQALIAEAVYDQSQPGETPAHVLATLAVNLTAPVPTVTRKAGLSRTATPAAGNPAVTATSARLTPTQTVIASVSPSASPSWTASPFATAGLPFATRTARPPAATATRVVSLPTATNPPAPAATATAAPLPYATRAYPAPNTPTPTQGSAYPAR